MNQQFIINTTSAFETYVFENNRRLIPTGATLTVYRPGGGDKLVSGATMTIGADGLLSYGLSATDNAEAASNYKAEIRYVYNAKTSYITLFYDVVRSKLASVITDDDVMSELPQLRANNWKVGGAATGGSQTTIVDNELKRFGDDFFTGGVAYSPLKGETREIIGFASSNGTVTTAAFSSAIAPGEKYTLTRPWTKEIKRAFEKMEERITAEGKRPELVLDPYDLRMAHIYLSVAEACKGLINERSGFWWELWQAYEKKAEDAFKGLSFKYDAGADGFIGASEEDTRPGVITAGRR